MNEQIQKAAHLIHQADAFLITAGAGMGVDSGLPDFRGDKGFWKAYPALQGYSFIDMANPRWFAIDPHRAWGFYGHRLNLYRRTRPHRGFYIIKNWILEKNDSSFVFTSNVDGQFQKAGFEDHSICECHGSIHHIQGFSSTSSIHSASELHIHIDERELRAEGDLPFHPQIEGPIRPNILMFGDSTWNPDRSDHQEKEYHNWLNEHLNCRVVIIEMGAGTAIPSVRYAGEQMLNQNPQASLIRINPRESEIAPQYQSRGVSLAMGALDALSQINQVDFR